MARNNILSKGIIALVVILAILIIWQFAHVPETEETPVEQVEEVDWEEVDKVEIISSGTSVWLTKDDEGYEYIKEDSAHNIDPVKFNKIISTVKKLKRADYKPVDFKKWSSEFTIPEAAILKFYKNTEQVLDLYIYPNDSASYFRYLSDSSIYKANNSILKNVWLDSLFQE